MTTLSSHDNHALSCLTYLLNSGVSSRETGTEENAAAYVAGWLRSIREGSAMDVVKAAQDAEKAVDFLTANFPAGGRDPA